MSELAMISTDENLMGDDVYENFDEGQCCSVKPSNNRELQAAPTKKTRSPIPTQIPPWGPDAASDHSTVPVSRQESSERQVPIDESVDILGDIDCQQSSWRFGVSYGEICNHHLSIKGNISACKPGNDDYLGHV